MTRAPRGLSAEEQALWARVAATVVPLKPLARTTAPTPTPPLKGRGSISAGIAKSPSPSGEGLGVGTVPKRDANRPIPLDSPTGLDSSWERKLARAALAPDFTLDLHGYGLDAAHTRLEHGLTLAIAQQARLVLVIAGKPRLVDAADRGSKRGAIRAKLLDWLAAGPHASRIAAVRPAHPRHGGAGAVYVVLRRVRP